MACARLVCNGVHNVHMVGAMLEHAAPEVVIAGLKTAATLSEQLHERE